MQAGLERDGYAVVPMLDAAEVASLRAAYDDLGPTPGDPHLACYSSFHSFDAHYKERVDTVVRSALDSHLARVFDRQRALPSNFIVKWPGGMSGFGLHQDSSLVDETRFRSVEVWVALEDTNETNGQLWMVPGSHRWVHTIRGIHAFSFPFRPVMSRLIARHSRPVPVRAGEAIVFTHAVVHFSYPNKSDNPRYVAIADLIPEEAPHMVYFGDGKGNVEAFAVGDDYWTQNSPFTLVQPPPGSASRGRVRFKYTEVTDEMLDGFVADGRAIESGDGGHGAINAAKTWCHRCGATGFAGHQPDRWVGNVTMLCPSCKAAEARYAPTPAHVGG